MSGREPWSTGPEALDKTARTLSMASFLACQSRTERGPRSIGAGDSCGVDWSSAIVRRSPSKTGRGEQSSRGIPNCLNGLAWAPSASHGAKVPVGDFDKVTSGKADHVRASVVVPGCASSIVQPERVIRVSVRRRLGCHAGVRPPTPVVVARRRCDHPPVPGDEGQGPRPSLIGMGAGREHDLVCPGATLQVP